MHYKYLIKLLEFLKNRGIEDIKIIDLVKILRGGKNENCYIFRW